MGTNYYHHKEPACQLCGHKNEDRHIGKSSGGWCFSLHVYPEEGISDLADWEREWISGYITDEYGETVSAKDMLRHIINRGPGKARESKPYGYANWVEFDRRNQSQPGPNGMLRHRVNDSCIKHGEGTWDCIIGEFS
jgi:hypothetical protein